MVAEIEYPYPSYVFMAACGVATLSSLFLKFPKASAEEEFEDEGKLLEHN